jgi:hypothetical protein
MVDLEHLEIYALKIYSNNLYIPSTISSKNPKTTGRLPGRKLFTIDPISSEQARVTVQTKFIIIVDKNGMRILEVPYAMLATKESIHKDDTNINDTSINITS